MSQLIIVLLFDSSWFTGPIHQNSLGSSLVLHQSVRTVVLGLDIGPPPKDATINNTASEEIVDGKKLSEGMRRPFQSQRTGRGDQTHPGSEL